MASPPKALLFDLDGTLAETDSMHFPAWAAILAPHGYEVDWPFYQENVSGRLNPDILAEFLPHLTEREGQRIIANKEADFRGRAADVEPLPGLLDFVARARERGLRLALVTNALKENALAVLKALTLEDTFDPIVVADDVGTGKPDPEIYHAALERLGIAAGEALVFEDSPSGIRASVAAGIPTIGVASTHDPRKLAALGADPIIKDFTDPLLPKLLL